MHLGANRKEEYRKVAELFLRCQDVEEAHKDVGDGIRHGMSGYIWQEI